MTATKHGDRDEVDASRVATLLDVCAEIARDVTPVRVVDALP